MRAYNTLSAVLLSGTAALVLAGCEPAGTAGAGRLDMITPAQQDQICLDAVKAQEGETIGTVITSDHSGGISEAVDGKVYDSVVTVAVGPESTQFHCLIDDSGTVGDIHSLVHAHAAG